MPVMTNGPVRSIPRRRVTVAEYHGLVAAGVLAEDDRVELLAGRIVPKMPHNPAHDGTIELIEDWMRPLLPRGRRLRIQSALTLLDSEPEPDLVVARGGRRAFLTRHPGPRDIDLAIEVADASLERDREKALIYARAGIPIYWIVNLPARRIEVYTNPTAAGYSRHVDYSIRQTVPLVLGGKKVAAVVVKRLLP